VGKNLVLTALHVVADRKASPVSFYGGSIQVRFPSQVATGIVVEGMWDARADWVLIQCTDSIRADPIPLGELLPGEHDIDWETFGFPDAKPDGMRLTGKVRDPAGTYQGTIAIQLYSDEAAAGNGTPVSGLSGAPCIVDDAVVGLIRSSLLDEARNVAGTLFACPITLIADPASAYLSLPDPYRGLPGLPRQDLPSSPYRYLQYYTKRDAEVFFGRSRAIRRLYETIVSAEAAPIILLFGQSGVGKSSLLEAGIAPRIESSHTYCYRRREQDKDLRTCFDAATSGDWKAMELRQKRPALVVLDQVEEAWVQAAGDPLAEIGSLLDSLEAVLSDPNQRPQGRAMLVLRKDWLPDLEARLIDRRLPFVKHFIERLDRAGVIEIVHGLERTARLRQQYGASIQSGLGERIASDLLSDYGSAVAPMLQIWMTRLWEDAAANMMGQVRLTLASYENLKREVAHLDDFLRTQISTLPSEDHQHVVSGLVEDILEWHTTGFDTAKTRTRSELATHYTRIAPRELDGLLEHLTARYLLTTPILDPSDGSDRTRLAHDTLASVIRDLYRRSEKPGQRARRILESRVEDWNHGKEGAVLDERDLGLVEQGGPGMRSWSNDEIRLVKASRRSVAVAHRRERIIRSAAAGAVLLIVMGSVIAFWQWTLARKRATISLGQALAAQSEATSILGAILPERALLLAVESMSRVPSFEADQAVRRNLSILGRRASEKSLPRKALSNAFSQNGQMLAIGSDDGMIRLQSVTNGDEISLTTEFKHVILLRISQDGKYVAAVSAAALEPFLVRSQRSLSVWDVGRKTRVFSLGLTEEVSDVSFSPDGKLLAAVLWLADTVKLIKLDDGAETDLSLTNYKITFIAFSNVGGQLATAGGDNIVRLWLLGRGSRLLKAKEIRLDITGKTDDYYVRVLRFSSDGKRLAIGRRDGGVEVWEVASGAKVMRKQHTEGEVNLLEFSPNGQYVASASRDNTLRVWDVDSGEPIIQIKHDDALTALAFAPHGDLLATASNDRTARVIDLASRQEIGRLIHTAPVSNVTFVSDQLLAATLTESGKLSIWQAQGAQHVTVMKDSRLFTLSPDRHYLAVGKLDGSVQVWDMVTWSELVTLKHNTEVWSAAFDKDDKLLITFDSALSPTDPSTKLSVHDIVSGGEVQSLSGPGYFRPLWDPTISPLGSYAATSDDKRIMHVRRIPDLKDVTVITPSERASEAWFSPREHFLVTYDVFEKTSQIWDVKTGKEITVGGHKFFEGWVTYSPKENYLGFIDRHDVCILFRVDTGKEIGRIDKVKMAYFSADERLLAVSGGGNTVDVWDLRRFGQISSFKHENKVHAWTFDLSGDYLATASEDRTARIWEVRSGKELSRLQHDLPVHLVDFGLDGKYLLTSSAKNWSRSYREDVASTQVFLWRANDLIEEACKRVTRNLSLDEWNQFIGRQEEYRCTCQSLPPGEGVPNRTCPR